MSARTTRSLKKATYCILEKFHDLEGAKERSQVITRQVDGTPAILVILSHLENVFVNCLEPLPSAAAFLRSFRAYRAAVGKNCMGSTRTLNPGYLANLEKQHTKLFNRLLKEAISVPSDCVFDAYGDNSLSKANLMVIEVWGALC